MKKALKIFGIVILILLVVLITAPFIFKGKIVNIANEQLAKNLNAKASFENINLSLIRNFPNLSIRLEGLIVAGIDEFEGDTLLNLKSLNIVVDVLSAIKMENIEIKQIILSQPRINALVLADGTANWDIVPESEETEVEVPDTTVSEFSTKISLKLFKISEAFIRYDDRSSNMSAGLENFNFTLSGDMSQDYTSLVVDSETEKLNFTMDGIRYLKNVLLKMHFDVGANLKESIYKLEKNVVSLNALELNFDGSIAMPESGDIFTDIKFGTNNASFKTLLSLVPAIYLQDYSDLQTTGNLKLDGIIKGAVTETETPNVDARLVVSDATFNYPDLPKAARDVQIDIDLHYDGVQMDNTTVDINVFHVDLGGNPIDLILNLRTPITDPFTNGKLTAILDLATLSDVVILPDTEMRGNINAQLDWMGNLSSIENQKYEEFKADGNIVVSNFYYDSPDIPKAFTLHNAQMKFSPRFIELASFDAQLGASDFRMQGRLSNYIPFVLDDKTIVGELNLNSRLIDLNEFMTGEDAVEETVPESDTMPLEVIGVPANIDFRLSSSIGRVNFDNLVIDNLEGVIIIKDQKVEMQNLSLNMLDGSFVLSGEYNTQDLNNPLARFDFQANNVNIPKAVEAFDVVGKMAPIAKKATGNISVGMSLTTFLTQQMEPVIATMYGKGNLGSKQIGIKEASAFNSLGKALNTDAFRNLTLNDINLNFEIVDGRILVEPFETSMGNIKMLIGGEQSLDNTLNYGVNLSAPRELLGLENPVVNNLYSSAASKGINIEKAESVNILARITGPMNDPQVKLDLKDNVKSTAADIKEELKETATQIIEEKKEEVKADVKKQAREEADKIIGEAEKQAATIKAEAKKSADAVRYEANANADKLIKEAGNNPLKKATAEAAAKKIRDEGDSKARKIESDAGSRADKVVSDAKVRANKLLQ
jgi:hypothetical protein